MAPPARNPAAQPARRSTVATTSVASHHDVCRDEASDCQLDWLQPALAIWLRDEAGPSVRMGDVHPTDGR